MEETIIANKFEQWVKGLDETQARISIFKHIRDIPYAIVPKLRDYKTGPSGMLELNKGSCQPKHFLLAMLFEKLNIPVKYVTYPFKWSEQPLKYTDELKKIVKHLPCTYHLASKAYIENKWVLADATYDLVLKGEGFPVTDDWDGVGNTKNAVLPITEIIHNNLEERVNYVSAENAKRSQAEEMLYSDFVITLNLWIENIRNR
ncbi:MAG: hypothetical protein WC412_00460 [Candidatus Omnitrophota bacterium]|jgi:hypothetical protein